MRGRTESPNFVKSQMSTVDLLMGQYGKKAVVPIDVVCRDHFAPLTVPTLVRKILAGEIELPLIRIERSRKSAKGVRIQDLAN
ncbi:pyocin activator protein PrtN [Paraburkholderia sp. BL6669N2]|nr:pyocin activator protein PrtN [Paraburkholderia sp. BL6669N2]